METIGWIIGIVLILMLVAGTIWLRKHKTRNTRKGTVVGGNEPA